MKYLICVLVIITSHSSFAEIVCRNGIVKNGDSLSEFKKKCRMEHSVKFGYNVLYSEAVKKRIKVSYVVLKIKLKNGGEFTALFLDDQLITVFD